MDKRLLMVVSSGQFFLSHRLDLARAAQERGYEVHVAVPPSVCDVAIRAAGFPCHAIPLKSMGFNFFKDSVAIGSLWRLYRRLRPDIVHHVTLKPIVYGGLIARMRRVPAVVHTFTELGWVYTKNSRFVRLSRKIVNPIYKYIFRHPHLRAIFQNNGDRKLFLTHSFLALKDSLLISGTGVAMDRFYPTPEPPGVPLVILPARLLLSKGIREFAAAAGRLIQDGIEARFVLMGEFVAGHPEAIKQKEIKRWVNQGILEYWGVQTDMPTVMRQAHIICLPTYRAGLSRALIEAAASARAVVSTDVGECGDWVFHGESGLLVPPQDSRALADALKQLIENPQQRQAMGYAGRKRVEKEYDLSFILEQTLKVYDDLSLSALFEK